MKFVDCDKKFICALKSTFKAGEKEGEEIHGVQVQIFQGVQFRNLLHLDLFFKKATDAEARLWLARKQVIAWGIINELSIEIEKYQNAQVKDGQSIDLLKSNLDTTKIEHKKILDALVEKNQDEVQKIFVKNDEERSSTVTKYEQQIVEINTKYTSEIEELKQELQTCRQQLQRQTEKTG